MKRFVAVLILFATLSTTLFASCPNASAKYKFPKEIFRLDDYYFDYGNIYKVQDWGDNCIEFYTNAGYSFFVYFADMENVHKIKLCDTHFVIQYYDTVQKIMISYVYIY